MTPSAISVLEKGWMLTGAFWLLTAIGQKRAIYVESAEVSARHGLAALAAFLLLLAPWTAIGLLGWQVTPQWHWMDLAGLAIGVVGFAMAFWARTLLGGEWSSSVALKAGHRLITIGPYAWLRHPIYSGLLLAMVGTAIAGNQLRMYIAVPVAFCAFWYKSRLEERLLLQVMGAPYQQYQQRTRAMIPGVL
jgi:protein-S-isoprenylcysteine O-methyltransferase Ste14